MRSKPTKVVFGVSLALLVAFCCLVANAQSGRRQAKPAPAAPVPSPTPEPTPSPTPKRNENDVNFLVASGDRGASMSMAPLQYSDAATTGCADELRKRTSAAVDVSRREMSRGEAIEKAKASKTTYVVLVTLVEDRYSASSSGYVEFQIEYVVFAPGTAKVVANGRTYENRGASKGPISVGRPRGSTVPTYREASFRRAGEEAADRILKSLHLDELPKTNSTKTADEAYR
jgi:hypothetical protein